MSTALARPPRTEIATTEAVHTELHLPGQDRLGFPQEKTFVSFEAVETLLLSERAEMLALAGAAILFGAALAMMLLIALLGDLVGFPQWLSKLPWWIFMLPSALMAIVWLRERRKSNKKFKADQAVWVAKINDRANSEVLAYLGEVTKGRDLANRAPWTPAAVANAMHIGLEAAFLGDRNGYPELTCSWCIHSCATVKHSVTVTGGILKFYMPGRVAPPITMGAFPCERFDGIATPDSPPIRSRETRTPVNLDPLHLMRKFDDTVSVSITLEVAVEVDGIAQQQIVTMPEYDRPISVPKGMLPP